MGLSEKVQTAVAPAIEMIETLIREILEEAGNPGASGAET
jgi:Ni,Fe-hydrogenase maturation factor